MAFRASLLPFRLPPRDAEAWVWALAFLGSTCASLGCADLTRPPRHRLPSAAALAELGPIPAPAALAVAPTAPQAPTIAAAAAAETNQIGASHILVAYRGATRAKPTVTRSKDEARALAQRLSDRAREPGSDFARLARDSSDGPTGIEGGALPKFGRQQMVKPFSDAAFALQPGQISDVVETNFGFHIIKRTE